MTVVIAGCGDVGTQAGLGFLAAGHSVLGLRRSPAVLPEAFDRQAIDLSATTPCLPPDTDIVVLITSADRRSVTDYESAYLRTTAHVLEAIRRDCTRSPRVLMVSSTSVWDIDDGSRIDETTPAHPSSPTAAVLLRAEELLLSSLPDVVVLRLGGIYGPGRGRMIDLVREGRAPSAGPHFTNRIHRDDAASAIVHLATLPGAVEPVYLGVDDDPAERGDVYAFLAAELGVDPPPAPTGLPATGKRCDNARLHASGFTFAYPSYREGYRAILAGHGVRNP